MFMPTLQRMRSPVLAAVVIGALMASPALASASFANRSLGLSFSAFKLVGDDGLVDFGLPLALEGSFYVENSFVFFLNVAAAIFYQKAYVGAFNQAGFVWGGGGQVGARYLFLEENVRPYAELHVAVLGIGKAAAGAEDNSAVTNAPKVFAGPGAGVGVDYFAGDSISVGVRGFFDLYITLNSAPRYSFGGGINVATYF